MLLNRGDGYRLISGQAEASIGDTVVANPGASGKIVYPDGCVVDLKPVTVATIAPQSPCTTGSAAAPSGNNNMLLVGAAVAGGGVAAGLLLSQKDNSASP